MPHVGIRLQDDVLERVEALIEPIGRMEEYQVAASLGGRVTRVGVIRLAVMAGLAVLEKRVRSHQKSASKAAIEEASAGAVVVEGDGDGDGDD